MCQDYPVEFNDIRTVISAISPKETKVDRISKKQLFSIFTINREILYDFANLDWKRDSRIQLGGDTTTHYSAIDLVKNGIGLEISFGKYAFIESNIFVKFPLFARVTGLQIGIVVVPMQSFAQFLPIGVSNFEMIRTRIMALDPLPVKYPFIIVGISDRPSRSISRVEMTSELDQFLISAIGLSMGELKLMGESSSCEFKERLPESRKIAQEVCAFANQSGGGIILFGVDDCGKAVGIAREELDTSQQTIVNVVENSCSPTPRFEIKVFGIVENSKRCILLLRVLELLRKPCMTNERVYVRVGSSARTANPAEIRRLVLGSAD